MFAARLNRKVSVFVRGEGLPQGFAAAQKVRHGPVVLPAGQPSQEQAVGSQGVQIRGQGLVVGPGAAGGANAGSARSNTGLVTATRLAAGPTPADGVVGLATGTAARLVVVSIVTALRRGALVAPARTAVAAWGCLGHVSRHKRRGVRR